MTLEAFLAYLELSCRAAGSQQAFAKAHGISPQYLSDVLRGRRDPGQKLLDAMGLKRVVSYQQNGG